MTTASDAAARRDAPRRRRRWPWILGTLGVLALIAWWWIDRQLEPERLAATVLARAGDALGLELAIDGTPEYALRPEPRLVLPNLTARMPGATTPLLTATRVEVSLPWSTLTGGDAVVITRVQLDRPVLDLAQWWAWQATRPAGEPFELPTLTNGLSVTDGRLLGDGWSVDALRVVLPELRPDAAVAVVVSGTLTRAADTTTFDATIAADRAAATTPLLINAEGEHVAGTTKIPYATKIDGTLDARGAAIRFSGGIETTGRLQQPAVDAAFELAIAGDFALADGDLAIESLEIGLDGESPLPDFYATGALAYGELTKIALRGELTQWPESWPALPPPLVDANAPLAFVLGYTGAANLAAPLTLDLERDDTTLHSVLVLPDVLAWLDAEDAGLLPPLAGELNTPALTIGGITLEGVRIKVIDDESIGPEGPPTDNTPAE
jgi:hypothetical protein